MTVMTEAPVPTLNPIARSQAEVGLRSSNKKVHVVFHIIDTAKLIQHVSTKCHKMSKIN